MAKGNALGMVKRFRIGQSAAKIILLERLNMNKLIITICFHEEKWAKIENVYPNVRSEYLISSYGRVLNKNKDFILKHVIEPRGYHCVTLSLKSKGQKRFYIHDLVAKAFIPKPDGKYEVNHINGNKDCNYIENLEWVKQKENIKHAIETGLRQKLYGENHHKNKYSEEFIHNICKLIEKGYAPRKIIKEKGIQCQGKEYAYYKRLIKHIKRKEQWVQISSLL